MVSRYFKKDAWRPLYPFESQWFTLDSGERMHFLDEGSGEPIVALHGNPTWSFYYRELVKAFKDTNRVVVPDHVGCGLSDKPQNYPYCLQTHIDNFAALVEKLQLEPFTMVVHDWGGAIGMGYAVRHPEMVKRILFMNTAAYRSKLMPQTIRLARVKWLGSLLVRGLNAFVLGALVVGSQTPMGPYVWNGYMSPYNSWNNRVGVLRFVQDIPMTNAHPTYQVLASIEEELPKLAEKPMSFVWGAKDHVFTTKFLKRWQSIYPQASVTRLDNAGHLVMEDASVVVIQALQELLKR